MKKKIAVACGIVVAVSVIALAASGEILGKKVDPNIGFAKMDSITTIIGKVENLSVTFNNDNFTICSARIRLPDQTDGGEYAVVPEDPSQIGSVAKATAACATLSNALHGNKAVRLMYKGKGTAKQTVYSVDSQID